MSEGQNVIVIASERVPTIYRTRYSLYRLFSKFQMSNLKFLNKGSPRQSPEVFYWGSLCSHVLTASSEVLDLY